MSRVSRRSRRPGVVATAAVLVCSIVAGCSGDDRPDAAGGGSTQRRGDGSAATIRVPQDAPTIAEAVARAAPGSLVLIGPGTYDETVTVETPDLTIRGVDRNAVVLDGSDAKENGFLVLSDGVAIENLTLHSYRSNGIVFSGSYGTGKPLHGYRMSYVTAYNNGLYGLYAFNAVAGQIDHTYTSGHPDAGIYIGQCYPCDALVTDNVAEGNAVGFQSTNAGGNLLVVRSIWRRNRVGIEPNSSTREEVYPQREATIVANRVEDNDNPDTPKATEAFGVGIAIGGGHDNIVRNNVITGHAGAGIAVTSHEQFTAEGNRIQRNTLTGNGVDLVDAAPTTAAARNCFEGNVFTSSSPAAIETVLACRADAPGGSGLLSLPPAPPNVAFSTLPAPPPQENQPTAADAPAAPALGLPPKTDLDSLTVPG